MTTSAFGCCMTLKMQTSTRINRFCAYPKHRTFSTLFWLSLAYQNIILALYKSHREPATSGFACAVRYLTFATALKTSVPQEDTSSPDTCPRKQPGRPHQSGPAEDVVGPADTKATAASSATRSLRMATSTPSR